MFNKIFTSTFLILSMVFGAMALYSPVDNNPVFGTVQTSALNLSPNICDIPGLVRLSDDPNTKITTNTGADVELPDAVIAESLTITGVVNKTPAQARNERICVASSKDHYCTAVADTGGFKVCIKLVQCPAGKSTRNFLSPFSKGVEATRGYYAYDISACSDNEACPANTYSSTGRAACTPCPAGQFSGVGATSCVAPVPCEGNNFNSTTGNAPCQPCPAGTTVTADKKTCVAPPPPACTIVGQTRDGSGNCVCPANTTVVSNTCVVLTCPVNTTGNYPTCTPICPPPTTGTYPVCTAPPVACTIVGSTKDAAGNCVCPVNNNIVSNTCTPIVCQAPQTGTFPNCVTPCPANFTKDANNNCVANTPKIEKEKAEGGKFPILPVVGVIGVIGAIAAFSGRGEKTENPPPPAKTPPPSKTPPGGSPVCVVKENGKNVSYTASAAKSKGYTVTSRVVNGRTFITCTKKTTPPPPAGSPVCTVKENGKNVSYTASVAKSKGYTVTSRVVNGKTFITCTKAPTPQKSTYCPKLKNGGSSTVSKAIDAAVARYPKQGGKLTPDQYITAVKSVANKDKGKRYTPSASINDCSVVTTLLK
jgi:hypothetical protein